MLRKLPILLLLLLTVACNNTPKQAPSIDRFADCIHHWYLVHEVGSIERLADDDYRAIADNLLAYQNEDGGWPKNMD